MFLHRFGSAATSDILCQRPAPYILRPSPARCERRAFWLLAALLASSYLAVFDPARHQPRECFGGQLHKRVRGVVLAFPCAPDLF